jgi:hypothetical protein
LSGDASRQRLDPPVTVTRVPAWFLTIVTVSSRWVTLLADVLTTQRIASADFTT